MQRNGLGTELTLAVTNLGFDNSKKETSMETFNGTIDDFWNCLEE